MNNIENIARNKHETSKNTEFETLPVTYTTYLWKNIPGNVAKNVII